MNADTYKVLETRAYMKTPGNQVYLLWNKIMQFHVEEKNK